MSIPFFNTTAMEAYQLQLNKTQSVVARNFMEQTVSRKEPRFSQSPYLFNPSFYSKFDLRVFLHQNPSLVSKYSFDEMLFLVYAKFIYQTQVKDRRGIVQHSKGRLQYRVLIPFNSQEIGLAELESLLTQCYNNYPYLFSTIFKGPGLGKKKLLESGLEVIRSMGTLNPLHDVLGQVLEFYYKGDRGIFLTPPDITEIVGKFIRPSIGSTVYDPACGTGSILSAVFELHRDKNLQFFGQELSQRNYHIAQLNADMRGMNLTLAQGNTIAKDLFPNAQFDYVVMNHPWNVATSMMEVDFSEPRFKDYQPNTTYSHSQEYKKTYTNPSMSREPDTLPKRSSKRWRDWIWFAHAMSHVKENGEGIFVVPLSMLANSSDISFRGRTLDLYRYVAGIGFPNGLFMNTGINAQLVVWRKTPEKGYDIFMAVLDETEKIHRKVKVLKPSEKRQIIEEYWKFRSEEKK
jgi:hypothetical protein